MSESQQYTHFDVTGKMLDAIDLQIPSMDHVFDSSYCLKHMTQMSSEHLQIVQTQTEILIQSN
jgi:hypothetical protein